MCMYVYMYVCMHVSFCVRMRSQICIFVSEFRYVIRSIIYEYYVFSYNTSFGACMVLACVHVCSSRPYHKSTTRRV